MRRIILSAFFFFLPGMLFRAGDPLRDAERNDLKTVVEADASVSLYQAMGLEGMVSQEAFRQAVAGYKKIKDRKRDVLTLHRLFLTERTVEKTMRLPFPMNMAPIRVPWAFI